VKYTKLKLRKAIDIEVVALITILFWASRVNFSGSTGTSASKSNVWYQAEKLYEHL